MTEEELAATRLEEFNAGERRKRRITYTFLAALFLALGIGAAAVVIYGLQHDKEMAKLFQLIFGAVLFVGAGVVCGAKAIRGN